MDAKRKDKVFEKPISKQFEFDEEVASVFDDMLDRSVPFYKDVLDLITNLTVKNTKKGAKVTDLGCSTATTLLEIYRKSNKDLKLLGIDNSEAMIQRAKRKVKAYGADIELKIGDFTKDEIELCDAILSNYTLQFVRPAKREELMQKIYDSLQEEGVFIFSEKIIYGDKVLNKQMIDEYYAFKKAQGYSSFEISQKREALENVLIPYTEEENIDIAKKAGFKTVETVFKWANFATFIAKKY